MLKASFHRYGRHRLMLNKLVDSSLECHQKCCHFRHDNMRMTFLGKMTCLFCQRQATSNAIEKFFFLWWVSQNWVFKFGKILKLQRKDKNSLVLKKLKYLLWLCKIEWHTVLKKICWWFYLLKKNVVDKLVKFEFLSLEKF